VLDLEHDVADVVDIGDAGIVGEVGEFEFGTVGTAKGRAVDAVGEEDAFGLGEDVLAEVDPDGCIVAKAHPDVGGVAGTEGGGDVGDEVHAAFVDGDLVGVGATAAGTDNEGVDARLGDGYGARGVAGGPEVGVGAVGSEEDGVVVANGLCATDEGVKARGMDGEMAEAVGGGGVGGGGEGESVVGVGGEVGEGAIVASDEGVGQRAGEEEGRGVVMGYPGEGQGGGGEVGVGEVGDKVLAGRGMDGVEELEARAGGEGVGGEIEGHDASDGDAMEAAGAAVGAEGGACAAVAVVDIEIVVHPLGGVVAGQFDGVAQAGSDYYHSGKLVGVVGRGATVVEDVA